jgi:site-specific recombinase XerD
MSQSEVTQLLKAPLNLREQCLIGLLYGTGIRISEAAALTINNIDSTGKRIKIVQGKGAKDRFTLLPDFLLNPLRNFYLESE